MKFIIFSKKVYTQIYSQSSVSKNPGSGSALTKNAGSGSAWKLMRIRNTVPTYNSSTSLDTLKPVYHMVIGRYVQAHQM